MTRAQAAALVTEVVKGRSAPVTLSNGSPATLALTRPTMCRCMMLSSSRHGQVAIDCEGIHYADGRAQRPTKKTLRVMVTGVVAALPMLERELMKRGCTHIPLWRRR